jgi:hypothetical protein
VTQQDRNVCTELDDAHVDVHFVLRDCDAKCVAGFHQVFRSKRCADPPKRRAGTRHEGAREQFVHCIRWECLDHLIVLSSGTRPGC